MNITGRDFVDLFIAFGAIYVGFDIHKTGWSYFYSQPVPKSIGLIFIAIGIVIIFYKIITLWNKIKKNGPT